LENVDAEEIYVDDADDSVYDEGFTETGAFAGPGYVEMPKSRVRRIFDRFGFGKDKKEEETSTTEWLDVEEDFDAREVGAARGSWESFQPGDTDDEYLPENQTQNQQKSFYDDDDVFVDDEEDTWQGGAASNRVSINGDMVSEAEIDEALAVDAAIHADEMREIHRFRNPDIDTEVWFVAVGSDLAGNAGMKAFIEEHEQDLRGAMIINLDALGAGELTYLEKEGSFKKVSSSSRMKRFMRKASQMTGVSISSGSIGWKESPASVALRKGYQAMSVVGMDGAKPAYFAQNNDVFENIEEDTLLSNSDFVMELIKSI